mgnify:CR=1 FL=1
MTTKRIMSLFIAAVLAVTLCGCVEDLNRKQSIAHTSVEDIDGLVVFETFTHKDGHQEIIAYDQDTFEIYITSIDRGRIETGVLCDEDGNPVKLEDWWEINDELSRRVFNY